MDLIQINAHILVIKQDHMKNSIKYRKVVKKIISKSILPDVLYKTIIKYLGSSPFPMNIFMERCRHPIRPHFFPKNTVIFHPPSLEEMKDQEQ